MVDYLVKHHGPSARHRLHSVHLGDQGEINKVGGIVHCYRVYLN